MSALRHIAPEVLDRHIAVLAMNGAGKTYGVKGTVVEPLLGLGKRVCVIDPTGVYWGLRLDPKGNGPSGLDVVIFGGPYGDFVIGDAHGEAVAEVIATTSRSAIIDTSDLTVGQRTRFFAGFAETLLRKNRAPLHLVIDEAHLFAPQGRVADPQSGRMLHAANNLISLGRSRGLRVVLISQRPAKLHKDSLTQAHSLVVMKLVAPQDRDAARAWIEGQSDAKRGEEVLASLAGLPVGHGWLWAPEIDVLSRIEFPKIKTFDSSRAPDADDERTLLLPKLETADIRTKIEAVAAEIVANDPAELKRRIADLEERLKFAGDAHIDAANLAGHMRDDLTKEFQRGLREGVRVGFDRAFAMGVNAYTELWSEVLKIVNPIKFAVENLDRWVLDHLDTVDGRSEKEKGGGTLFDAPSEVWRRYDRGESLGRLAESLDAMLADIESGSPPGPAAHPTNLLDSAPSPTRPPPGRAAVGFDGDGKVAAGLTPAKQRILDALAWQESIKVTEVDRPSLAFLAGASPTSSSYANNLGALRTAGLIEYRAGSRIALTGAGQYLARKPERRLTHADILRGVLDRLVPAQGRIVAHVAKVYPKEIDKASLARTVGASATSSSYANNLGRLRSLGLIQYRPEGKVRADDRLFP